MTIAYWCILATMILPYLWVAMARLPGLTLERNLIPRLVADELSGVRQRLYWAHLNALEVIAPFSAAVIIAHSLGAQPDRVDQLALAFIAFRVGHALAYVSNLGVLRTIMFACSFICIIALFVSAA